PATERGRRLRSPSTVNKAIRAFLRAAPGGWNQIFTRSESGNVARQEALRLPESLQPLIVTGTRDALIRRLDDCGMRRKSIARLTGADLDRVNDVMARNRLTQHPGSLSEGQSVFVTLYPFRAADKRIRPS